MAKEYEEKKEWHKAVEAHNEAAGTHLQDFMDKYIRNNEYLKKRLISYL